MKPICVGCERFMRPKKSGFYFIEGMPSSERGDTLVIGKNAPEGSWKPYKFWVGDLWECPDCKVQAISGVGAQPITEHYQSNFTEILRRFQEINEDGLLLSHLMIKDC